MSERLWQKLGAACGILYVVLLFGPSSIGSDSPVVLVLELIALLLFIPFLGYLWSVLRRDEGEGEWLTRDHLRSGSGKHLDQAREHRPGLRRSTGGAEPATPRGTGQDEQRCLHRHHAPA
jgi:hypothetical protein